MKRLCPALLALALAGWASTPAWAVPPTATPSPGYDARLEEQRRAARAAETPIVQPPRRAKRVKAR
jgi:hypothetical protein